MIIKVTDLYVADDLTPTEDDVREAIKYAQENNVTVHLHWSGPGWQWYPSERWGYLRTITPESDFDEVWNSLPKIYGV